MKKILIVAFVLAGYSVHAQNLLTIGEALQLALKNNYEILLARDEAELAKTNNTAGAAGLLPNIGFSGSGYYALKSTSSTTVPDEPVQSLNGLGVVNAAVELSWTVFDGGKMWVTKMKLDEIEARGEILFKDQVVQTLYQVVSAYFNIVKQKQQLAAIEQSIAYTLERVKIAEAGFQNGLKSKTDLLQARIDLNVNRENAINQEVAIEQAKRELSRLLILDQQIEFEVENDLVFDYQPNREEIQQKVFAQNPQILASKRQLNVERLTLRENTRSLWPKIQLNTGYYFQGSQTWLPGTGLISSGRSLWPQIGASVSVPVFQGGNLKRQIALSKIDLAMAETGLENLKLQVNTDLQNAFTAFEQQQNLLKIEMENFELARENLEISLQRMRLGEATSLEVRMSQSDFEQSATRLTTFKYNVKLAEAKLKQLLGEL